jgi:hypothetical protein
MRHCTSAAARRGISVTSAINRKGETWKGYIMTEVEKAELTVKNLENIRKHLIQQQSELADERGKVALAAHTGDKKSRTRLDEINLAAAKFVSEFASIESAIVEANKNLDAARRNEALAQDRANALAIRALNAEFKEAGDDADDALWDLIQAISKQKITLDKMHQLGTIAPTLEQFRVNGTNAIKTGLQALPPLWLRDFEFQLLAPNQKKKFKDVTAGWHDMIERQIAQRLGENKEKAA